MPFIQSGVKKSGEERRRMTAVKHAAVLSETPVREAFAPMVLDADEPVWKSA